MSCPVEKRPSADRGALEFPFSSRVLLESVPCPDSRYFAVERDSTVAVHYQYPTPYSVERDWRFEGLWGRFVIRQMKNFYHRDALGRTFQGAFVLNRPPSEVEKLLKFFVNFLSLIFLWKYLPIYIERCFRSFGVKLSMGARVTWSTSFKFWRNCDIL